MARIEWGAPNSRVYQYGVDRGVLYIPDALGQYVFAHPWDGLISVELGASGPDSEPLYQDGVKYNHLPSIGDLHGTLTAFTYPDAFLPFDGVLDLGIGIMADNQPRDSLFGLSYRTWVGDAESGPRKSYKIHLLYNLMAEPKETAHNTLSDSFDISEFGWDIHSIPMIYPGIRPTSHFIIDSSKTQRYFIDMIEAELYGNDQQNPTLPSMKRLREIFDDRITDVISEPL